MVGVGARNNPVGTATSKPALARAGLLEAVRATRVPGFVRVGAEVPWVWAKGPEFAWVGVGELDKEVGGYLKVPMPCSGPQHLCKF